jgi:hypothetical protein
MTLESQTGISLRHAPSVVDDLDRGAPSINDDDMDGYGSCVDSILHQLLHDGSRTLNYLTSGYLVGNAIGEKGDDVGHFCL